MTPSRVFYPLVISLVVGSACKSSAPTPEVAPPEKDPAPAVKNEPAPAAKVEQKKDELVWESVAAINGRCEDAKSRVNGIRTAVKAVTEKSEATVLVPVNMMMSELDTSTAMMDLIANTHPDKTTRDEADKCSQALKALANELSLDRALYDVFAAVDVATLDADAKRFVEKVVRNFRRSGVDKDEATRGKLQKLQDEMTAVGQDFGRNIREDVKTIEVDPKDLLGLPDDFIKAHKVNEQGKVVLTTNYPDFFPVQTYAKNEEVRKKQVIAFFNRAVPANDEKLKKLLELRAEYAKTLGYPSWAQYQAEDKMVKSAAAIEKFIGQLAKLAKPRMQADLKELLARKKKDNPKAKAIEVWDRFYYVDVVRTEKFGVDSKVVRSYFDFNNVLKGLFELYGELFGLRFERATDLPGWHESVLSYRMFKGDEGVGQFYLDLHPRDGKYQHAAMFPVVTGLRDGAFPVAALVCNFPQGLMEHAEVKTFFHEFGHLIHHLLARNTKWVNQNGTSVEWDFVEAPSQLLEEWVWDAKVLARFAKHVDTKEPIPAELVEKMRKADELGKGKAVMRQLKFAALSYELHSKDPKNIKLPEFLKDVDKRYSPYPNVPGTYEYASFGHLDGYSSMYYTYQWSLVMAKDIFTRFAKAGLMDATTAAEYREKILARGGQMDASAMMRDFLGRDANLDAYRAWLERN